MPSENSFRRHLLFLTFTGESNVVGFSYLSVQYTQVLHGELPILP
ncbi:TPA: hypothetical protein ACJKC4_000452 [Neisseria meningitidis]|nr:hypothetical protein [Neisseria meningitidis]